MAKTLWQIVKGLFSREKSVDPTPQPDPEKSQEKSTRLSAEERGNMLRARAKRVFSPSNPVFKQEREQLEKERPELLKRYQERQAARRSAQEGEQNDPVPQRKYFQRPWAKNSPSTVHLVDPRNVTPEQIKDLVRDIKKEAGLPPEKDKGEKNG